MKKLIKLLPFILLGACTGKGGNDQEQEHDHYHDLTPAQAAELQLTFTAPGWYQTGDSIAARGMVHAPPQSLIDVSLPYGGLVSDIAFYEGSYVKKGQVMARVRHSDYIALQEDYLKTLSRKEVAAEAYARQEKLGQEGATSEKALQEARAELRTLEAQAQGLRARLTLAGIDPAQVVSSGIQEDVIVRAPVNGYVTGVFANTGMYVQANAPLYRIVDNTHLHIELAIFPDKVHTVKPGQRVYFYLGNSPQRLKGEVHLVSHNVDADRRSVNVHVHPDADVTDMLPGMFVKAAIITDMDSVYALPPGAAMYTDEGFAGLVEDGGVIALHIFSADAVTPDFVTVPRDETRKFATGNLGRGLSAILDLGNEAGHSH